MKPFWLNRDLMEKEHRLLQLCLGAHYTSALLNQNVSSVLVAEAARGSMDFGKALISGLCSIGGIHAPLVESWNVLAGWDVDAMLKAGQIIPGWGSSFEAKEWEPVNEYLLMHWSDIHKRIEEVTAKIKATGRDIKPNASCYTAAVGMALSMPVIILPWLFVKGRLDAWSIIVLNVTTKKAEPPEETNRIITN